MISGDYLLCVQRPRRQPTPKPKPKEQAPERDEDSEEEEEEEASVDSEPKVCCWPLLSDHSPRVQWPTLPLEESEEEEPKQSRKVSYSTTLGYG
jgi:hypothetical protein